MSPVSFDIDFHFREQAVRAAKEKKQAKEAKKEKKLETAKTAKVRSIVKIVSLFFFLFWLFNFDFPFSFHLLGSKSGEAIEAGCAQNEAKGRRWQALKKPSRSRLLRCLIQTLVATSFSDLLNFS